MCPNGSVCATLTEICLLTSVRQSRYKEMLQKARRVVRRPRDTTNATVVRLSKILFVPARVVDMIVDIDLPLTMAEAEEMANKRIKQLAQVPAMPQPELAPVGDATATVSSTRLGDGPCAGQHRCQQDC